MLTLDAESISLDTARGRILLTLAQLDGIRVPGDVLELYLSTGDVIQLAAGARSQRSRHGDREQRVRDSGDDAIAARARRRLARRG